MEPLWPHPQVFWRARIKLIVCLLKHTYWAKKKIKAKKLSVFTHKEKQIMPYFSHSFCRWFILPKKSEHLQKKQQQQHYAHLSSGRLFPLKLSALPTALCQPTQTGLLPASVSPLFIRLITQQATSLSNDCFKSSNKLLTAGCHSKRPCT